MHLDIQWSSPYKVYCGSSFQWRREWCIPTFYLKGFFEFWKKNRFDMLADGFTVTKSKATNQWFLLETKDLIAQFRSFGNDPSKDNYVESNLGFSLPEYQIKDVSGLRPWQVGAAGKLVSAINQWGAAIDGSELGCHTKGTLIRMFRWKS